METTLSKQKIIQNHGDFRTFHSFPDGDFCRYRVVLPELLRSRPFPWGYTGNHLVISSQIPENLHVAVLQMEYHRTHHDKDHREAVAFALSQGDRYRRRLIDILLPLYVARKEGLEKLKAPSKEQLVEKDDIEGTVRFLQLL
ncbi:MAG TPA: hypothetical protein VLG69_00715 [Candidatus Andersenbacteria bacterium]|nr:hypothetical protein [Candidatus Andersenbacteria bacterium]